MNKKGKGLSLLPFFIHEGRLSYPFAENPPTWRRRSGTFDRVFIREETSLICGGEASWARAFWVASVS
jgi:hypothetical protein